MSERPSLKRLWDDARLPSEASATLRRGGVWNIAWFEPITPSWKPRPVAPVYETYPYAQFQVRRDVVQSDRYHLMGRWSDWSADAQWVVVEQDVHTR